MVGTTGIVELSPVSAAAGPFALDDEPAYIRWRALKLATMPRTYEEMVVNLSGLACPCDAEIAALVSLCRRSNFAFFRLAGPQHDPNTTPQKLKGLANGLGLRKFETHRSAGADGIVALEVTGAAKQRGYIPYTDRPLGWHTDGYYNYEGPHGMIRAMLLYCARDAQTGGDNSFLDHEIAYIRLRDQSLDHIVALMHPQAMTIPENREAGGTIRPASAGPVFVVDPTTGSLAMRYTRRKRHIVWRDNAATRSAVAALEDILDSDEHTLRLRLEPGTGIVSNNVLHARSGFVDSDSKGRLFYRLRSYDRIAGT